MTQDGGFDSFEDFGGVIGPTIAESTPSWPVRRHPGTDAPNVVLILLDDTGFAQLGCFGSTMHTPNIDKLAAGGLRYTNFHVTPLCSPTRAALLTGRNHHEVGMRSLANFSTGFPNMRGHISDHAATIAEILRDEGFATFAAGKWHLCQMEDASAAGPYDQWPCQRGFDRFYGFLDGETDQFHPELVYDNHRVDAPAAPEQGYHLTADLVDHAIEFMHDSKSIRPDRPFFLYLATGAMHAPHQAPPEYLARYRGTFDEGWDAARADWFARQHAMGLFPQSTQLAPRNPGVEEWATLPENHRRLAARLQEAFAGFLDHTDVQIGRLIAALDHLGELDNTLILLLSDNGASQEGGPFGVLHEWKYFNFVVESPDEAVARIDDIGGPDSHTNYPWGWAQAGNTPFKWYKQNTHEGGVHVPLIVHWPREIPEADRGGLRDQFHHVTDIAPTIYDLLGVTPPQVYRGFRQLPVTGSSMRYTLGSSSEPSRKQVQYFEMMGHRAIYADGWKAVTKHTPGVRYEDDDWELYHVAVDRSECVNLAASQPERLAALVELWWSEAREHGVLPLDDRTIELFAAREQGAVTTARAGLAGLATGRTDYTPHPASRHYTYRPPMSPMPAQASARIGGRSWDLDATITRPAGAGGVLYALGNGNSGLSVFISGDRLVFDYNCFGEHHVAVSDVDVPVGDCVVGVRFRRVPGGGGRATLVIDGTACGGTDVPFVMFILSSIGSSVGYDHGSAVSDRYESPFAFEGSLDRVDIQIVSARDAAAGGAGGADPAAAAHAREAMSRQ
ncbi:MAG TPA: arylsulfatase [Streptosporangiaceae bacterium]|nr:arylsulfatase [Streptosporangiaceae bacterium]